MTNFIKISKDDYYKIIIFGEFSQEKLYSLVNKEKKLTKMYGLNIIENLVQDYVGIVELDSVNRDDSIKIIIQDFSESKKKGFKTHISVMQDLFNISDDEVKTIELFALKQKEQLIEKGELLKF